MTLNFNLNGQDVQHKILPGEDLLHVLNNLGISSLPQNCSNHKCGLCSVLIDGKVYHSCLVLAISVNNRKVETVENIIETEKYKRISEKMAGFRNLQCNSCQPRMLIVMESLFREHRNIHPNEFWESMQSASCSCVGYRRIMQKLGKEFSS